MTEELKTVEFTGENKVHEGTLPEPTDVLTENENFEQDTVDAQKLAEELVNESEEATQDDDYTTVDAINRARMIAQQAIQDGKMIESTKNKVREENFSSNEEDMDAIEESLLNDGALKLMPDPSFWTFDDVKKHFTKDGELIDVELDMDEDRKKEYILDYARLVYMNHYAIKEIEAATAKFQEEQALFNEEVSDAIKELDVQTHTHNGVLDVNSVLVSLLEKDINDITSKDELTWEEKEQLDNTVFTLNTTKDVSLAPIIEFIKTRTAKQILNTYKRNSKSIVDHMLSRIAQMGMTLNNAKWTANVKDFEGRVFYGTKQGSVGNMFIMILSYWAFNRKDIWVQADTVFLRRVINDLVFLLDQDVEHNDTNSYRYDALTNDIFEVLSIVINKIEATGKDYVKTFN